MIDQQERNKVWTMIIIPQSVEVQLSQDTSRSHAEITMYDMANIYTTLGCASGSGILVSFLIPSLQVHDAVNS